MKVRSIVIMMDFESLRKVLIREEPKPTNQENQWAAVAVILNPFINSILIGKRTVNPHDPWSGDAAFPGGRFNPLRDLNLVDTAIREAREEVGIDLVRTAEFLGHMGYISPSNAPNIKVLPVIFRLINNDVPININTKELSKTIWLNIQDIPTHVKERVFIKGLYRPAIIIDDITIWGMTYRILRKLIRYLAGINLPSDPKDAD